MPIMNTLLYKKTVLPALFAFAAVAGVSAQEAKSDSVFGRTVVVEKEYNPDINDADKVNRMPAVEKISTPKSAISYALDPVAITDFGEFIPVRHIDVPELKLPVRRGVAYAGYGLRGNADAGVIFDTNIGKRDRIGVNASFTGENGLRDLDGGWFTDKIYDWKAKYYDTDASLNYTHTFDGLRLDVAGGVGYETFNFIAPLYSDNARENQNNLTGNLSAGVVSTDADAGVGYHAGVKYSYFRNSTSPFGDALSNRQNRVLFGGGADFRFGDGMKLGADIEMNCLTNSFAGYGNYTTMLLNPYYAFGNDVVNLRAGLNIDLGLANASTFNVSPDVTATFAIADNYKAELGLTGGRTIADFAYINSITPYWYLEPDAFKLADGYTLLNASASFAGSPVEGFRFRLSGGYEINKSTPFVGLYEYRGTESYSPYSWYGGVANVTFHDADRAFAGGELSYEYRDILSATVRGEWNMWTAREKGYKADRYSFLAAKPLYDITANVRARIVKGMYLNLSYRYAGYEKFSPFAAVNSLDLTWSYTFFKGLGVYASGTNLLNKDFSLRLPCPVQGISMTAGISYSF